MTRREFILTAACFVAASAHPAFADVESDISRRLGREGFQITRRRRTWLGRIRIEATDGQVNREVVFDPTSGEILRDYTSAIDDGYLGASARGDRRTASRNPGSGPKTGSGTSSTSGSGATSSTDSGGVSGSSGGSSGGSSTESPSGPSQEPAKETPKETPSGPSQETSRDKSKSSSKGAREASSGGN